MEKKRQPRVRRKFISDADELNYLNDVIRFRLGANADRALVVEPLLHRFHELLKKRGMDDGSIMLQDHWAVFNEAEGRIALAIEHREKEVALLERLFAMGGPIEGVDYHFLGIVLRALREDYRKDGLMDKVHEVSARIAAIASESEP